MSRKRTDFDAQVFNEFQSARLRAALKRKPRKQTSPTISSIAGKYARKTNLQFDTIAYGGSRSDRLQLWRDFRKVCASCLSQDEKRGQK